MALVGPLSLAFDMIQWRVPKFAPTSGVYELCNTITGDTYVGASGMLRERLCEHLRLLRRGKHPSDLMQLHWFLYGPGAFTFTVLEEVATIDYDNVLGTPSDRHFFDVELRHIHLRQPTYNTRQPLHPRSGLRPAAPRRVYLRRSELDKMLGKPIKEGRRGEHSEHQEAKR
jgi:hypothetical protein